MMKKSGSNNSGDHYTLEAITAEEIQEAVADSLACAVARIIYTQFMKEQSEKALTDETTDEMSNA